MCRAARGLSRRRGHRGRRRLPDRTARSAPRRPGRSCSGSRGGEGRGAVRGERAAPPGPLLLADADLRGRCARSPRARPTSPSPPSAPVGGGLRDRQAASPGSSIRLRTGFDAARAALGPAAALSPRARGGCFPLAPGFGCEVRMTIDALRAGLDVEEIELDLDHRATGRDAAGFAPPRPPARSTPCSPAGRSRSTTAASGCRSSAGLRRRTAATRRCRRRRARARRRPLERARARLPRAPPRAADDRRAQARRASRSSASLATRTLSGGAARRPRGERPEPARHEARAAR